MADLWERYVLLGLRLGRHVDGLVDAYFGPTELQERVDAENLADARTLVRDAAELRADADSEWLRAQVLGCETTARRLAGEEISWADEVERCYGVRPAHTDESAFAASHERLEEVLPGRGDLADRYRAWQDAQVLPPELVLDASVRFQEIFRERTRELFGLPEDEDVAIETVQNEPWGGFNYYAGGRRSRVVINTDLPMFASRLANMVAHETYPGHHAEHAWKEVLLVDGQGNLGEAILLVGTPQSTVSEGIASLAPEIVGAYDVAADVYRELGVEYDAEANAEVRDATESFEQAVVNAALGLHEAGWSRDGVVDYLVRWTLVRPDRAEKSFEFMSYPTWRAYISCYSSGYELCSQWVAGDTQRFRRLLTEQLTTADLAA